jgi:phosphoribosylformylglycinamidine cyclo-ligase
MVVIVRGWAAAGRDEGVALLGGETAEMPGLYREGDFDIAGCMVGSVREAEIIDGSRIQAGDVLIALPSTGLHTNGYSLARAVVERAGWKWTDELPGAGLSIGEALLAPHRSYVRAVRPLVERLAVTGLAHITGGGIAGNLVRVLPGAVQARLVRGSWERPLVFRVLQERGAVPEEDMLRTFNLGVGFILAARPEQAEGVQAELVATGERPWVLGEIVAGSRGVTWV